MKTERTRQLEAAIKSPTTAAEFHYLCADGAYFAAIAASEAGAFRVLNAERPGMHATLEYSSWPSALFTL